MMHQFQSDAQKDLYDQIHHEVSNADMYKHVANETPRLVAPVGIVNEESRCWTVGALPNALIVVRIVPKRERQAYIRLN